MTLLPNNALVRQGLRVFQSSSRNACTQDTKESELNSNTNVHYVHVGNYIYTIQCMYIFRERAAYSVHNVTL